MDGLIKAWVDIMRAQDLPYLLHCRDKNIFNIKTSDFNYFFIATDPICART